MSVTPKSLRDVAEYMRRASGVDPIWLREAAAEIERLQTDLSMADGIMKLQGIGIDMHKTMRDVAKSAVAKQIDLEKELAAARDQLVKAKLALAQIKHATLCGRVCDDVAWFDSITTLHDFCDLTLDALSDELREGE